MQFYFILIEEFKIFAKESLTWVYETFADKDKRGTN